MNYDNYLKNLLGVFATTVASNIESEVAELGGRSLSHESALVTIRNHPNDGIDVLSKVLGITHSGAARLVDTLVRENLVERQRSDNDARAVVLRVTAKGRNRANKVLAARDQVTSQILGTLNAKQKKSIVPALETMLSAMTQDFAGARRICRFCDEGVCRSNGCPVEMAVTEGEQS